MKKIDLGDNKFALIDDEDFELVSKFRWRYCFKDPCEYAVTTFHTNHVTMQWLILGNIEKNCIIDHKDRNGLNNQKSNLRFCISQSNRLNSVRKQQSKSSKYKGVSYNKVYKLPWCAGCQYNGKKMSQRFATELEAAKGYDKMARDLHGEMAYLNFP